MTFRSILRAAVCAALAALVLAPLASAHVEFSPEEWAAGGFGRFALTVPNEEADASTTKVVVQFPESVVSASFLPVPGWTRTVTTKKLATPVTDEDGNEITERIDTVSWQGGEIKPGEFQEFGLSFEVPDEPGTTITFPAVQTYSNGDVVRWIGEEGSEEPAPALLIVEASGEDEHEEETTTEETETTPPETTTVAAPSVSIKAGDDDRANLALGLGMAGLIAGLGALGYMVFRGRKEKA
jgi:uncharacterized protein YcnI